MIQKYIERPLLINERKFDIRVWSLLTQNLDLYVFKEGYLRMSSENYDVKNIDNAFIHLTNNAVQQYSKNYGQFESGNQLSFSDFQHYLDRNKLRCSVRGDIIPRIYQYITLSMAAVRNKINKNDRKFCFELFGFDFIIDEQFTVWLIEVNTNPCIEESSSLLKQYIPRMLDDALKLTIDQIYPPRYAKSSQQQQETELKPPSGDAADDLQPETIKSDLRTDASQENAQEPGDHTNQPDPTLEQQGSAEAGDKPGSVNQPAKGSQKKAT